MMGEPDFTTIAIKVLDDLGFELPSYRERSQKAVIAALRDAYEQGKRDGYIKGSDDMGNIVVQLEEANK